MKINLILDVNNIFYQKMNITGYATKIGMSYPKTDKKLGSKEAVEIFKDRIHTDFEILLNKFPTFHKIYFCKDSGSWRKKIKIADKFSYKEKRIHNDVNWDGFNEGIDDLISRYENIVVLKQQDCEADDLVYLVNSRLLKNEPDSINIIYSTDGDFTQLLQERTIIYKPVFNNERFQFSEDFDIDQLKQFESLQEPNLFSRNINENIFDVSDLNFGNNKSKKLSEVIEDNFDIEIISKSIDLWAKLFVGDKKDDVPACYNWVNSKGVAKRVTPAPFKKLLDYWESNNLPIKVKEIFTNIDTIAKLLSEYCATKTESVDIDPKILEKNIKINFKLLCLSDITIPKHIIQEFDEHFFKI